jgi:hypothetical protein
MCNNEINSNLRVFNIEIAKEYGLDCAYFLQNIYYWVEKNRAENRNFRNGNYWTYSTIEEFEQHLGCFTKRQLKYIINKLKEADLILIEQFSEGQAYRTYWYALTGKALEILNGKFDYEYSIPPIVENENPKKSTQKTWNKNVPSPTKLGTKMYQLDNLGQNCTDKNVPSPTKLGTKLYQLDNLGQNCTDKNVPSLGTKLYQVQQYTNNNNTNIYNNPPISPQGEFTSDKIVPSLPEDTPKSDFVVIEKSQVEETKETKKTKSKGSGGKRKSNAEIRIEQLMQLARVQLTEANVFTPELEKALNTWLIYKQEKKTLYVPTGWKNLLTRIEKIIKASRTGEDYVISLIDDAMTNNWQGFLFKNTPQVKETPKQQEIKNHPNYSEAWGRPIPASQDEDFDIYEQAMKRKEGNIMRLFGKKAAQ